MNIILKKQIEPLFELISSLHCIYNERSLEEDLNSSLSELNASNKSLIEKDLKKLYKFLNTLKEKIALPKERMEFFFNAVSDNFYSAENIAALIVNHITIDELDSYKDQINSHSDNELEIHICKSILRFLDFDYEDIKDTTLNKDFVTECLIKDTLLRDTGKWRIMVLLNKPRHHILEVIDILSSMLPVFNKILSSIEKDINIFIEKIDGYLKEDKDFIKSLAPIDMGISSTVYLYPTIVNFNSLSLKFIDEEILDFDKRYNIYLGWKFKELYEAKHSEKDNIGKLNNSLKALSDKSKLQIITMLKEKPMYGQEIADKLSLTTATVSHHMNNLMTCNFVYINKVENKIYYNINKDELKKFISILNDTIL